MLPQVTIDSRLHWEYYIALEDDLLDSSRYVEFCTDNFATYSTEFTTLLLAACSEVDVVAKEFCKILFPDRVFRGMKDYRSAIIEAYPHFWQTELMLPRFRITLNPWEAWENDVELGWWRSYNGVKHDRAEYYKEGNLKNAIEAAAALLSVQLYFYRHKYGDSFFLDPPPRLISSGKYAPMDPNARLWGYDLPDKNLYTGQASEKFKSG